MRSNPNDIHFIISSLIPKTRVVDEMTHARYSNSKKAPARMMCAVFGEIVEIIPRHKVYVNFISKPHDI